MCIGFELTCVDAYDINGETNFYFVTNDEFPSAEFVRSYIKKGFVE